MSRVVDPPVFTPLLPVYRNASGLIPIMACRFNESAVLDGLARLPKLWLRDFAPLSIGVSQERATYIGLKGWGRTRFLIRRGRLLYAPTPPNGCVLRRTPILAWALLETLERHPSLPDASIPFNWYMHTPPLPAACPLRRS